VAVVLIKSRREKAFWSCLFRFIGLVPASDFS